MSIAHQMTREGLTPPSLMTIHRVLARATLRPVCAHLIDALERHGVPEEILTDIQGIHQPLRQDRLRDAL